ncbi:MAG: mechanosensitive ion channel family protein [Candidatus Sumerlaeota bacterium]|nr:mechanosensitive ion channel family protein [Candidatus Sumerlaeota bacterium]
MIFWQYIQTAAGLGGHYHWAILGAVAAALVLALLDPESRPRLRAAVALVFFSLPGVLVCAYLLDRGVEPAASSYRWLHFATQLCLAIGAINLAGVLVFRVLLKWEGLQPPPILRDTMLGLSYLAAALFLLSRHSVNLSGIIATSAIVTAIIGFSLQETLGNIMGGMALQLERTIGVGDWIRINDVEGLVSEIRWRHTSIETRDWDTIIIPNSVVMKSQVRVLGRRGGKPAQRRMSVNFDVDLNHAPHDVIEAVEKALRKETIPNVAPEPRPDCILFEFTPSAAQYAVRYWLSDLTYVEATKSEIRARILVALQRAGMGLAFPTQNVFMTVEGRTRDRLKRQEEMQRRMTALNGAAIFQPLTDEERSELAARLAVAPFRRGEVITRQGAEANHLYIMTRGDAAVSVSLPTGESQQVAALHPGDVFGEMGLMTGEARQATVTALKDVVSYRLDKTAFAETLERRPEIAEAMSLLLARRRMELDATTAGLTEEAMRNRTVTAQRDLLQRMRRFFMLAKDSD